MLNLSMKLENVNVMKCYKVPNYIHGEISHLSPHLPFADPHPCCVHKNILILSAQILPLNTTHCVISNNAMQCHTVECLVLLSMRPFMVFLSSHRIFFPILRVATHMSVLMSVMFAAGSNVPNRPMMRPITAPAAMAELATAKPSSAMAARSPRAIATAPAGIEAVGGLG